MKVAHYGRYGDPAAVIEIADAQIGDPSPDEVVIAMEAAPVHLADLYCMQGKRSFRMPLPAIPGYEGIGRIKQLGGKVKTFNEGDRVFAPVSLTGGTWREETIVAAGSLIPAPDGDAVQLALMPINPPTAYLMLEDFGELKRGDWVIQNAANSNCGRYLIELAKLKGIRTVNVVRRQEVIPELEALGGDVVLLDGPDLPERVKEATGGQEMRLAIDAVNGEATERLGRCLADDCTILAYGMLTDDPCKVPPDMMFIHGLKLIGFWTIRQFKQRTRKQVLEVYEHLTGLVGEGKLTAKIAGAYPLDQVKEAVTHAARRGAERDGKVILTMQA